MLIDSILQKMLIQQKNFLFSLALILLFWCTASSLSSSIFIFPNVVVLSHGISEKATNNLNKTN